MRGARGRATWRNKAGEIVVDGPTIAARWRLGHCLCCAGPLTRPHAIAEQVQICGRCADGGHLRRPGEVAAVLMALATEPNEP